MKSLEFFACNYNHDQIYLTFADDILLVKAMHSTSDSIICLYIYSMTPIFGILVADCSDPPLPDPADTEVTPMITLTPENATTFGTIAIYSCELGYQIVGNETRVCQIDSQWSGATPFCEST